SRDALASTICVLRLTRGGVECSRWIHRRRRLDTAIRVVTNQVRATSAQVVYGRLAAPSCDRYAARLDFASLGSGAGSETGAGLSRPSTVRERRTAVHSSCCSARTAPR